MLTTTDKTATTDLHLASYLVASGWTLERIEGPQGLRRFCFDKEIPTELVVKFRTSFEKRLLDANRNLKIALMTTT